MNTEDLWTGLDAVQANGLACVTCGRNYLHHRVAHQPVGRSHTGSQVFACADTCVATLTEVTTR
jgi:hypothetical protein